MLKLIVLALLFNTLLFTVSAESTSASSTKHFLLPRFNGTDPDNPDAYQCVSERAPDYYGIGVRVGVYFSWWTAWVANSGMPSEVMMAQDQNAVFLFANVIALVRCTITFVITQLDALIMFHLGLGTILGVLSTWGYRSCYYTTEGPSATRHFGGFGTHLRLLLACAVCCFGVWFWIHGITPEDREMVHDVGPCGTVYTFMFGKVDAAKSIRYFYIIASVFWVVYFGIQILFSPLAGLIRAQRMVKLARRERYQTTHRLHIATGYKYKELRLVFQILRIWNFFWLVWSMITIEMTLNYNHVDAVLGPGNRVYFPSQLIPMIIGAFSFCRLLYLKFEKIRNGDDVEPTVSYEPPIEGEPQPRPKGKDLVRLFAPPKGVPRKASDFKDPVADDIDARVEGDKVWLRYLVAYLPWLSLLPRWQSRDHGPRRVTDPEKHNGSDQDTLRGLPDAVGQRAPIIDTPLHFSNSLIDDSDHTDRDAVQRSRSRWMPSKDSRRETTIL